MTLHSEQSAVTSPLPLIFDASQRVQRIGEVGIQRLLQVKDVFVGAFNRCVEVLMIEFIILFGVENRPGVRRKTGQLQKKNG